MDTARTTATTPTQANNAATAAGAQGTTSQSSAMHTTPLYAGAPAVRLDSGGEPLPPSVQRALESSFQADMGMVRVHSDARSTAVADSLAARAFSYGPNIYLGSGERASDLGLMAHEGAHIVQQQGSSSPVVQMSSSTPAADPFEQEARRASVAVQQGESFTVTGRTAAPRVQKEDVPWYKRGLRAVASGVQAVASVATAGKDLLLSKAAAWAKKIPGYDLLAVVLGKDPITDKPVERNAANLLRGIAGLIPGGAEMFDNLQKSGALQKAFDWFSKEIDKLNLTWEAIKGLFRQFWDSLSASDILDPSGVYARLGALFGPPLKRLEDFALASGKKILELIVEGALSLAGAFGKQVLALLQKGANAFSLIIKDPLGFLRNLLLAVKGGFQNFSNNIVKHLKTALFEWLFGALQGAGLTLPDKFDLRGIISIILQVLGLTYTRMREKLVKLIGEPAVAFIEKAFEFLKIIVTQGIAAAWQKLLEFATGLVDTVVEGIRNWVVTTIVKAAITKLVTMFNPVGAIIQGIITIYNTISFFIERAKQIAALANAIFDSIINIANGNLGAAIDYVEKTMARTLPVIIGFLASLIGLGGISGQIKKIIEKIQAVIDNAINKVVSFIVDKARGLFAKATGKDEKKDVSDPEHDVKVKAGLLAIDQEDEKLQKDGKIGRKDAEKVAAKVRKDYPVFKSIKVVDGGDSWDYDYVASPANIKKNTKKKAQSIKPKNDGQDFQRILNGELLDLTDYLNPVGNQFPERTLDPNYKSPRDPLGRTNQQRAKAGLAPLLPNGDRVVLHHRKQNFFDPLDELSAGFHQGVLDDPEFHQFTDDPGYLSWRGEVAEYGGQIKTLGEIYDRIRGKYWRRRF